jgi:hypothetical protein
VVRGEDVGDQIAEAVDVEDRALDTVRRRFRLGQQAGRERSRLDPGPEIGGLCTSGETGGGGSEEVAAVEGGRRLGQAHHPPVECRG